MGGGRVLTHTTKITETVSAEGLKTRHISRACDDTRRKEERKGGRRPG